jgi:hypothetical protein
MSELIRGGKYLIERQSRFIIDRFDWEFVATLRQNSRPLRQFNGFSTIPSIILKQRREPFGSEVETTLFKQMLSAC